MKQIVFFIAIIFLGSCNTEAPSISYGKDLCEHCKMTIMDKKFGAVLVNTKGKNIRFDSGECMLAFMKSNKSFEVKQRLIINYSNPEELIEADKAFYLHGGSVISPMGGGLAAFKAREDAENQQKELSGDLLLWHDVSHIDF